MVPENTNKESPDEVPIVLKGRSLIILVWLVGFLCGALISACDPAGQDPPPKSAAMENATMKSETTAAQRRQALPPLELIQPQMTETATFAMG